MPVITFADEAQIPAGFEDIIKKTDDGKFTINVVSNEKLTEFRDNNTAIAKDRDALKLVIEGYKKIVGEDADQFATDLDALRIVAQDVENGKLKAPKDIEAAIEAGLVSRVAQMTEEHTAQLTEVTDKNVALTQALAASTEKFNTTIVDKYISDAVLDPESGVNVQALPDILTRARAVYRVNAEDEVVPMKADGTTVIYGTDGVSPMSGAEFVQGLQKTAPHFFAPNTGGDAEGSDGKSKYPKGMSEEEFNKQPAHVRLDYANKLSAA